MIHELTDCNSYLAKVTRFHLRGRCETLACEVSPSIAVVVLEQRLSVLLAKRSISRPSDKNGPDDAKWQLQIQACTLSHAGCQRRGACILSGDDSYRTRGKRYTGAGSSLLNLPIDSRRSGASSKCKAHIPTKGFTGKHMPTDHPTAAHLWRGEVSFFSIDTDLIQGARCDFEAGALDQLSKVLPQGMTFLITDVVVREIVSHFMRSATDATRDFNERSDSVIRAATIDMTVIDALSAKLSAGYSAAARFGEQVRKYAERCRGSILPIQGEYLADQILERYFARLSPFTGHKEKKSQFTHAASLLLLEAYARDHNTKGVVASMDSGWRDFAADSEFLYCVASIDELIALFKAAGEHTRMLRNRLVTAIGDERSNARAALFDGLKEHVSKASWNVGAICSHVGRRVEAKARAADIASYQVRAENTKVRNLENHWSVWIVELTVWMTVNVLIELTFCIWDSIDRELLELEAQLATRAVGVEVKALLICSGVQADADSTTWSVDVEIAHGEYTVDVGEVEPDFRDE